MMRSFSKLAEDWVRENMPAQGKLQGAPAAIEAISSGAHGVWREPFLRWLDFDCVRRPRDFTALLYLNRCFSQWMNENNHIAPTLDVFEHLLIEHEFLIGEVSGMKLVAGLMRREDLLTHEWFQRDTWQ